VKGYPTILKKKQIRFLSFYKSKTYKNAQWTPKYTGSKDYILTGDEVERELKSLYRIVWNVSIRGDNGKVHKLQTHVASIQYWAVVEEFKEFLQYRQERIKNKGRSESMSLKRSYLPGHVPKLEKAIDEFIVDVGNDISIEGRIYDAIKSKVLKEGDNRVDLEEALEKISRKWNPIKKEIVQEYVASEEFTVWLSNEAMRKKGPRRPTKEEFRDQQKAEEQFRSFKEAFGNAFSGKSQYQEQSKSSDKSKTPPENKGNGHITNLKLAKNIVQAGYRALAKAYHPDAGGDEESMKELNRIKEQLDDLLL
jgi:hypothetical protein